MYLKYEECHMALFGQWKVDRHDSVSFMPRPGVTSHVSDVHHQKSLRWVSHVIPGEREPRGATLPWLSCMPATGSTAPPTDHKDSSEVNVYR